MKITKITEAEFNAIEECTDRGKTPLVRTYSGNLPVKLTFATYDLEIAAGEYKWLVFVPCELIGEFNWIRILGANNIRKMNGRTAPRSIKPSDFNIIELENNGVLFAGI